MVGVVVIVYSEHKCGKILWMVVMINFNFFEHAPLTKTLCIHCICWHSSDLGVILPEMILSTTFKGLADCCGMLIP